MKLSTELSKYLNAKDAVASIIGFYPLYSIEYGVYDWNFSEGDLTWFENGEDYSEEASLAFKDETFSLFLVYSCTGDKYYLVLPNLKEM